MEPPRTVERKLASSGNGASLLRKVPASHLDSLLRDCRSPLLMMRLKALGVNKQSDRLALQQALREEEDRIVQSSKKPTPGAAADVDKSHVIEPVAMFSPMKKSHPLSDLTNSDSLLDLTNPAPSPAFSKRLAATPAIAKPATPAKPQSATISTSPTSAFAPTKAAASSSVVPTSAGLIATIGALPRTIGRAAYRAATLPWVLALAAVSLYISFVWGAFTFPLRVGQKVATRLMPRFLSSRLVRA